MHKISWIIPAYALDEHRQRNLAYHKNNFLANQEDVEIEVLVVEQDKKKHPVFNKSWLCNRGVLAAAHNDIVIADMDVYSTSTTYVRDLFDWIRRRDLAWAFGWTRLLYQGCDGKGFDRNDWPEPGINEGGIVYFSKDLWRKMGGANEWVKELRGPDNELALKARYLTGYHIGFPHSLFHRWHPVSPMKYGRNKAKNKEILKYTRKNMVKVLDLLKKQNWGDVDGPYCGKSSFFEARTS